MPGVLALAEEKGVTAYDASHLWLARALDAELVTLDPALAAAYQASWPPFNGWLHRPG